jgi:hypothetical protein
MTTMANIAIVISRPEWSHAAFRLHRKHRLLLYSPVPA